MKIIDFINERIENNKHLFEEQELITIKENQDLVKKIYLLAGVDVTNSILK